jgi:hypothetical protein
LPRPDAVARGARAGFLGLFLLTSACATRPPPDKGPPARAEAEAGMATGDTGLGLAGAVTPAALKALALTPYLMTDPPDCTALGREINALDGLLGPDLDTPAPDDKMAAAQRMAMGVVRGAIPYRWAVRWLTQAGRKDRELQRAILGGVARRGYLKGVRHMLNCPPSDA